jgi:hypothetical protein
VQSLGADKDREAKPSYAQLSPRVCEFRSLLAFVARDVDDDEAYVGSPFSPKERRQGGKERKEL